MNNQLPLWTSAYPAQCVVIECGRLRMDWSQTHVTLDEKVITLSPKALILLWHILARNGEIITRVEIMRNIWRISHFSDTRSVDIHIQELFRALGKACPVETVWSEGYRATEAAVAQTVFLEQKDLV